MKDKYLIICLNCASPNTDYAFFLLEDENENTVIFDTEDEAKRWIKDYGGNGPFAHVILCTGDFVYQSF